MCVSAATQSEKLSDVLDEKQADIVTKPEKYEVRFKAVEVFEDITHQLRKWFAGQDDAQDIAAEIDDSGVFGAVGLTASGRGTKSSYFLQIRP